MTEVPMKEITISGKTFAVSQPFSAGHVLTEGEAKALNQVRAENIRNNMASSVKTAFGDAPTEELSPETISKVVADYDAQYVFTVGSVGTKRTTDPLEAEAIRLARTLLSDALKTKGIALSKVPEEARNTKIAEIAARPGVIAQAKKNLESRKKMAESVLDGLDLANESEGEDSGAAAE